MFRQQKVDGRPGFYALLPPWMRKLLSGNKRFWAYTPEEIERHLQGRELTQHAGLASAELRQAERDEIRKQYGHVTTQEVPSTHYDLEGQQASGSGSYEHDVKDVEAKEKQQGRGAMLDSRPFDTRA